MKNPRDESQIELLVASFCRISDLYQQLVELKKSKKLAEVAQARF